MKTTLLIVLGCLVSQTAQAGIDRQIRIRLQDYAGVSMKLKSEALAVAEQILTQAAVSPIWLDCSPALADSMDDGCRQRPNAQDIVLRLLPEKMAAAVGLKTACLGYAVVPRGGFGTLAAVFVDKARREAERALASRSAVLGHAVAHEIAHLLIGKAEHGARGLMQPVWSRSQLLRATAEPMALDHDENRAIAEDLHNRSAAVLRSGHTATAGVAPELHVRILNEGGVSKMMLREAVSTATKAYEQVGVKVSWLDCTPDRKRIPEACRETPTRGTRLLRLVPGNLVRKLRPAVGELGRAALREDRSGGRMAYVFPSLVEDLAERAASGLEARLLFGRLLGYAMAHELAHLLGVHHGEAGVMGVGWGLDELGEVRAGAFGFAPAQAARVRTSVEGSKEVTAD